MKSFHVILHGFPDVILARTPVVIDGVKLSCLKIPPEYRAVPLAISFDEAAERLDAFPRLHCEPDGCFVWRSSDDTLPWQVDGNLFEGRKLLSHVELKGVCSIGNLSKLLNVFCDPSRPAIAELIPAGVFADARELTRLLKR